MNDTFLKACHGERAAHTPVWLMRQGGRSIPRFREMVRDHGFLDICRVPELAAEATFRTAERACYPLRERVAGPSACFIQRQGALDAHTRVPGPTAMR